ncbi:MAG: sodium:solute symporter family protein [Polyangia bacterium]|jgi:SSS family solute:Na+ symporter|nr:sodium:solute symporter family protein [Polyangia bacterium]
MHLTWPDWLIIGAYLGFALGVGLLLRRRASRSTEEFFLAGRSLPWWLAGTSMVATTFAADTPLAITEYVRDGGIWRNWFWWSMALFHVLGVFLFARLWRRAGVLTDAELCEKRYEGRPAAALRTLKAFLFAVPYNVLVMAWVMAAMATILEEMMGVDGRFAVAVLAAIALLYAGLSGLWGVVVTDLAQFALALGGTIVFAFVAVGHTGGLDQLVAEVTAKDPSGNILSFVPSFAKEAGYHLPEPHPLYDPLTQFLVLVTVMWWANHNADGGGALMQRSAAAKDERHALWAAFWFSLLHYSVRAWPWILVALATLILVPSLPEGAGEGSAYPRLMAELLPAGLRGLLVAAFMAAFMSTIDTHLNWGASYLVRDLYVRRLRPEASEKHALVAARLATALLMVLAALASFFVTSISGAWEFVWSLGAGLGPVLILRWFWWRVNAWSELVALGSSLVLALILPFWDLPVHVKALILVPATIACWLPVTLLTRPVSREHLGAFYALVRPGGCWRPVVGDSTLPKDRVLTRFLILDFASGLGAIFGLGFGLGSLLLGRPGQGALLLVLVAGCTLVLFLRHGRRPRGSGA